MIIIKPMEIKYDTPIEVTRSQYIRITSMFNQIVAHRIVDGKYYIKLWLMNFKDELIKELKKG